jgi:hypothetical protein
MAMANDVDQQSEDHTDSVPDPGAPSNQEHPHTSFSREDDRWDLKNQLRDWLILLAMMVIYLTWTGIVYFFEPGIR